MFLQLGHSINIMIYSNPDVQKNFIQKYDVASRIGKRGYNSTLKARVFFYIYIQLEHYSASSSALQTDLK